MSKAHYLFAVAAMFAATAPSVADDSAYSGFVVAIPLKAKCAAILHDGMTVPLGYNMPVFVGDQVSTNCPDGPVSINLSDGSPVVVVDRTPDVTRHEVRSSYTLPRVAASHSWLGSIWRELGERLTRANAILEKSVVTMGGGDASNPLTLGLPGLADGQAEVAAGERRIGVAWAGGEAPFAVRLTGEDGTPYLDASGLQLREVITIRSRLLKHGRVNIEIRDASGRPPVEGHFMVMRKLAAPPLPPELSATWILPEVRMAAQSQWLAEQDGERLSYEAYLRLVPYSTTPQADLVMKILAGKVSDK